MEKGISHPIAFINLISGRGANNVRSCGHLSKVFIMQVDAPTEIPQGVLNSDYKTNDFDSVGGWKCGG